MDDVSPRRSLLPEEEPVLGFFAGYPESHAIFEAVLTAAQALGPVTWRVTKSQVALLRAKPFAWAWIPARYLRGKVAPLVLSFSFAEPRPWYRWKEIYRAGNRRFTHHVELWTPEDVDDGVREWLAAAWESE